MGRVGIWSDSFYRIIHKCQPPVCMGLQCTPLTPALVVVTKTDVETKNARKIFIPCAGFEPRPPELRARDAFITPPSNGFEPCKECHFEHLAERKEKPIKQIEELKRKLKQEKKDTSQYSRREKD